MKKTTSPLPIAAEAAELRYLRADHVRCPEGSLTGFEVCTADRHPIGSVEGVLISPSARRLAYVVIDSPGPFLTHRRYLLPVDDGVVLQHDPKRISLSARKDELELQPFTPAAIADFSDDDLLETLFAPQDR